MKGKELKLSISTILKIRDICSTEFLDETSISVKAHNEDGNKETIHKFAFDRVFNPNTTQIDMYECTGKPIVESKKLSKKNKVFWRDLMVLYLRMVKLDQERLLQ